jgi:GxxExxY protein
MWLEDGKMLLELKVVPQIQPLHRAQALSYLKVTDADLAMVVNFGEGSLVAERLPNFVRDKVVRFVRQKKPIASNVIYPDLTGRLLEVLYRVHFELGPGFLHQVYRRATMMELREQNVGYRYIKQEPVYYQNHHLGVQETRLICVEGQILVATVAVQEVDNAMKAQLKARMRHQHIQLGLLANFNRAELEVVMVR